MSVYSKWFVLLIVGIQVACTSEPKEIIVYDEDWEVVEHRVEETGPRLTQTGRDATEFTACTVGHFLTFGLLCPSYYN